MRGKTCREKGCEAEIVLVHLDSGNWMPVDPEAIPVPAASLVAINHGSGRARVLRAADVGSGDAARWAAEHAVTFHRAHFATCKARRKKQLALPVDPAEGGSGGVGSPPSPSD